MAGDDELRLYAPHRNGMRYLLAQSPDTRALVPDVPEGAWEPVGCKKGVQMFKEVARPPERLNKTRGIGVIAAPSDVVAKVVSDEYERWDDTLKELRILTGETDPDSGALVEIIWSCYSLHPPLIKDRDFVYREVTQQLPGGVWIIYGQSLPAEEAAAVPGVPQKPSLIRGEMGASGWVIAPVEGGAASSVTYVSLTDLKGSFPPLLVNKFVNDVPLTVDAVRKVVLAKAAAAQKA